MRRLLPLLTCLVVLNVHAETVTVVPSQGYDVRRQNALALVRTDESAAEKQLLKLVEERGDDPVVLVAVGQIGLSRAQKLNPGDKRRKALKEVRVYFERAHAAGSQEPYVHTVLDSVNPDGSEKKVVFSENAKLDERIKAAERAFEKRDFPKAIAAYQEALALDPRNYTATLYLGDTYFTAGQLTQALTWFGKAAEIDPNRETAFRYAGDALMRLGKMDLALDQYLWALVAEPYTGYPNRALQAYCQANGLVLGLPAPQAPFAKVAPGKNQGTEISMSDKFTVLDVAYSGARAKWQAEHPAAADSKPVPYRQTLAEEANALRTTLKIWEERNTSGKKAAEGERAVDPDVEASLRQLQELETAGLLEAHILFARANQDIAADYAAYRDENRGKLHAYLNRYYLHRK